MNLPPNARAAAPSFAPAASASRTVYLVVLLAVVLASATYKYRAFLASPRFASQDDTSLFWSESAFHYRYARMIAHGDGVPALDRDAEWPEGVAPFREFTFGMEYAAGLSFRALRPLLGGAPFHIYLAGFIATWSSLSIAAAFFAARALWRSPAAGLVAALAYALSPASISRTIWNFVREDFTLPFLFASFALFIAAWRSRSRTGALAAGAAVTLTLGVATWHLARFYLLAFAAMLSATRLAAGERAAADAEHAGSMLDAPALRAALVALVLALIAAGAVIPVLAAKRLLLSPGFLMLGAVTVALLLETRRPSSRSMFAARLCAIFAVAMIGARLLPSAEGEYAHVTGLILAKLRFLGVKPDDPSLLPEDARVFWVGPFNSPNLATTLLSFSTMLLWAPAALISAAHAAFRARLDAPRVLALLLALFFAAGFLFIERLVVFLVFFAAIVLPVLIESVAPNRRRAIFAVLALLALCEFGYLRDFQGRNPWRRWVESRFGAGPVEAVANPGENPRLAAWLRSQLPARSAILTWFPTGPMVLTDTAHPTPLHSMFESSRLRAKERRMREALYGTELEMWDLCRDWQAEYFLYQANLLLDTTKESYRYMAGRSEVSTSCAAYRFHFHPERLSRFTLVYQDSYFRLFRVEAEAATASRVDPSALPYSEIFDASLIGETGMTYPDERSAAVIAARDARFAAALRGAMLEDAGRSEDAARLYREVLDSSPDAIETLIRLALLEIQKGRIDGADSLLSRALAKFPHYAELHFARGLAFEARGQRAGAIAAYREALAIAPGAAPARERLIFLAPDAAAPLGSR